MHISNRRRRIQLSRTLSLASLSVTALLLAVCPQAQAADAPTGVPNYQGARQVLRSAQVHDTVSRFLGATANVGADGGQQAAPMAAGAREDQQPFSLDDPVALYEITPDFVTGKARPTTAGALRLSYLAALVHGSSGHQATVLLSTGPKGAWQLAGVRDGAGDVGYADQATQDSTVFTEPQIHAWYRLKAGTVQPLNQEAVAAFGGKRTMSLSAYQKLVHGRYANKLPGSSYDRKGLAGGYGLAASAHPSATPSTPALLGGSGAALALVAVGGTVAVRRRNRSA
jgi:hypothetical protein